MLASFGTHGYSLVRDSDVLACHIPVMPHSNLDELRGRILPDERDTILQVQKVSTQHW